MHFPSDEALHAALVHLDRLNIFLYYPSVLPELVFCSPCVLLDKISKLVEESYRLKHGPDPSIGALSSPHSLIEISDLCVRYPVGQELYKLKTPLFSSLYALHIPTVKVKSTISGYLTLYLGI